MKLEHVLKPFTKINSKWIKELNVRPKNIELLDINIGRTHFDINHRKILYDPSPIIMEIKTKINKWELINLKCFCTVKVKVKSFSHVRLFVTPVGCSLPGSSVHGIFQARVLEWVAIPFSRGSP